MAIKQYREKVQILKQRYEESPFTSKNFQIPLRRRNSQVATAHLSVTNTETQETVDVATITRRQLVDADKFVKVYLATLNSWWDLKPTSMKIVTAIMQELGERHSIGSEMIHLSYKNVQRYFEERGQKAPARNTFAVSLSEIIENGFIAPAVTDDYYYINPAIFFNGDRVRLVTEIRKKRAHKNDQLRAEGQEELPFHSTQDPTITSDDV